MRTIPHEASRGAFPQLSLTRTPRSAPSPLPSCRPRPPPNMLRERNSFPTHNRFTTSTRPFHRATPAAHRPPSHPRCQIPDRTPTPWPHNSTPSCRYTVGWHAPPRFPLTAHAPSHRLRKASKEPPSHQVASQPHHHRHTARALFSLATFSYHFPISLYLRAPESLYDAPASEERSVTLLHQPARAVLAAARTRPSAEGEALSVAQPHTLMTAGCHLY
jgi:hypothetical protein